MGKEDRVMNVQRILQATKMPNNAAVIVPDPLIVREIAELHCSATTTVCWVRECFLAAEAPSSIGGWATLRCLTPAAPAALGMQCAELSTQQL